MWCVPEINDEYKNRMEDVLNLYNKPFNKKEPVICIDEKPVQLIGDVKTSIPAIKNGQVLKKDYEYKRNGTANIFGIVEPKGGQHLDYVTKNRVSAEYAKALKKICDKYPEVKKIHLVQDNLKTHSKKSVIDFYGEKEGKKLYSRFKMHYTPKHASWLNQAEIELSLIGRQCLGKRRIGEIKILSREVKAFSKQLNKNRTVINWKFTTKDARKIFKYNKI
jgi:DDE superfamily endonuclease